MKNVEKSDEKQGKFEDFSKLSIWWYSWGVSRQLEAAWRRLWAVQGRLGGVLEAYWRYLGRILGHVADILEVSWGKSRGERFLKPKILENRC